MKIIHLSFSDILGGAAQAAYRIHHALLKKDINSTMWVEKCLTKDTTINNPSSGIQVNKYTSNLRSLYSSIIYNFVDKIIKTDKQIFHSPALMPSSWVKYINRSDADIINLHWINNEMLSVKDISKIKKPIVWTLHDMWSFCGAEHYTDDTRWREGYNLDNRPLYETGFDLNLWTWKRKIKYWKEPMQIITPSTWLANCVRQSKLMASWPISKIAYPIDTNDFRPLDQKISRAKFNLPQNVPLVLFGAFTGTSSLRKGFDLLLKCLNSLKNNPKAKNLELVIFGKNEPEILKSIKFPCHNVGFLSDNLSLASLYNAVDAIIISSRQDNLPLTGIEAQACGTPVISFKTGGMSDILEHKKTGYLSQAFDNDDLGNGILWALNNKNSTEIRNKTRQRALVMFSPHIIANQYISVYQKVLETK